MFRETIFLKAYYGFFFLSIFYLNYFSKAQSIHGNSNVKSNSSKTRLSSDTFIGQRSRQAATSLPLPPSIQANNYNDDLIKIWDKSFGESDWDILTTAHPTLDGGYILGGYSLSNLKLNSTQDSVAYFDYWIVRVDANSNKLWQKHFLGNNYSYLQSITPLNDGSFILGGWTISGAWGDKSQTSKGNEDYWIIRIDASGNKIWDKSFGGKDYDYLKSIIPASDGGYILGGYSNSIISGDKTQSSLGGFDYWIIKIDENGNKLWDKRFGGNKSDYFTTMCPTSDGGYLLGGYSSSNISGDKTQNVLGENDFWIIKITSSGTKVWDKQFGGEKNEQLEKIISSNNGDFILAGWSESNISTDKTQNTQGGDDYWIIKVDYTGNKIWDKRFGGSSDDRLTCISNGADGGYLLGGYSYSNASGDKSQNSNGGSDYWILKIGADGTKTWDKQLGGSFDDILTSMLPANDGGYLFCGYSNSPISAIKSQSPIGGFDYWLLKTTGKSGLCGSNSTTLSASGCSGTVNWSTGAVGLNITINVSQTTTVTATCTLNGLVSINSNPITIYQPSVPTISTNATSICAKSGVTLSITNCLGVPTWSTGVIGSTFSTTFEQVGTMNYTATCTQNGCKSLPSPPITITIKAIPPQPVISKSTDNTICPGQSVLLTVNNCVGSVSWLPSGNGNRLVVSPNTTKTYTAVCTATNSCVNSNTSTVSVDPNQMYSIKSGNWNDSTVWSCGRIPTLLDSIKISFGHTISINTLNNQAKQVNIEGILNYSIDNSKLSLNR